MTQPRTHTMEHARVVHVVSPAVLLREALGGNGRATLAHAGGYAESRSVVPAERGRAR